MDKTNKLGREKRHENTQRDLALVLWTECLCPSLIHMLKPNPQWDGIRGGAFGDD